MDKGERQVLLEILDIMRRMELILLDLRNGKFKDGNN